MYRNRFRDKSDHPKLILTQGFNVFNIDLNKVFSSVMYQQRTQSDAFIATLIFLLICQFPSPVLNMQVTIQCFPILIVNFV